MKTQKNSLSFKSIIASIFNGIASLVDLVFCIPVAGRLLKWLWNSFLTFIQLILGLLEYALNYHPTKVLRIGVVILKDEEGNPLTTAEKIYPQITRAQKILEQASIKVVPAFPPPKKGSEDDSLPDSANWIRVQRNPSSKTMLDVDCNFKAMLQDLVMTGTQYQFNTVTTFFDTSFRRVFGFGAPITVYVVREIHKKGGCSLGWLSDYVTVRYKHTRCITHEVGHACNLMHTEDEDNLMYPKSCAPEEMTPWQIILMRASRHLAYF